MTVTVTDTCVLKKKEMSRYICEGIFWLTGNMYVLVIRKKQREMRRILLEKNFCTFFLKIEIFCCSTSKIVNKRELKNSKKNSKTVQNLPMDY